MKSKQLQNSKSNKVVKRATRLLADICSIIEAARTYVSQSVNSTLVILNWKIGERIHNDILSEQRAEYGKRIVSSLGRQLTKEYGEGFSEKNLRHMIRFVDVFPDEKIVSSLSRQLSWTHFRQLIYIEDPIKREFYTEMCRIERWSVRTLSEKTQGLLYERTGISRKPTLLAKKELAALKSTNQMTPDLVFRNPYFLNFLGLKDTYSEKDFESAILRDIEHVIIEFGSDFAFVARQKHIAIDGEDYYIDLLFYHRGMKRLVAIDLKLGKFQAADKGQMELYLHWLDKYERRRGEAKPIGLILCAEKTSEHVELLQLEKSGIRVAEYFTELPPKKLLKKKLHEAIQTVRDQIARRQVMKENE